MGIYNLKKIIAIFVVVAFIWIGIAWASDSSTPQFQEKAGTPVVKKPHKFPWLIALLGVAAVGVGIYFLTKKKNDDSVNQDSTLEGTLKETFSSTALSGIPVYAVGGGKTFTGTTDGSGYYSVKVPSGNYSVLFNISDTNVIGSGGYVPSKLSGVSVNGVKTVDLDLAEYAVLFPVPANAAEIIQIYRGRDMNGINKRWDHTPADFIAYIPPSFTLDATGKANILKAYDWIRQYSDNFIQAPSDITKVDIRYTDHPDYTNSANDNVDLDSLIYAAKNIAGAKEWFDGNKIKRSIFFTSPDDLKNLRGEGVESIQGGDNESDLGTSASVFAGRNITPLDLKWGKFNYRLRKPGERIYIVSGNDACEDRIL
ncbi:MAG: hypothetical protein MUO31_12120 [Thermodesulfovibrionales bacterium]|nr:hypothetical protein [Thermodesulfovibrionales bacterium]